MVAALLGSGQAEVKPNRIKQSCAGIEPHCFRALIYGERNLDRFSRRVFSTRFGR
jgi:hypothetical protein